MSCGCDRITLDRDVDVDSAGGALRGWLVFDK